MPQFARSTKHPKAVERITKRDTFPKPSTFQIARQEQRGLVAASKGGSRGLVSDWYAMKVAGVTTVSRATGETLVKVPSPMGKPTKVIPPSVSDYTASIKARRSEKIVSEGNLSLKGLWLD